MSKATAIFIGNFGRDPELGYIPNTQTAVCNFSIATTCKHKEKEITQWHRCIAFNGAAETIAKFMKKGSKIYLECRIEYDEYEKDGVKVKTPKYFVDEFEFC